VYKEQNKKKQEQRNKQRHGVASGELKTVGKVRKLDSKCGTRKKSGRREKGKVENEGKKGRGMKVSDPSQTDVRGKSGSNIRERMLVSGPKVRSAWKTPTEVNWSE